MQSPKLRDSTYRLLPLLAIVVITRFLVAFFIWRVHGSAGFFRGDTPGYIGLAQSLLHGSFLSPGTYSIQGTPEIFRPPGYPLLLLPAVALQHVVIIGLLENFLLAAVSAWLVWTIVTDLFPGSKAASWAVLLYCFEPMGLVYSETLMSEIAFTTLFLLFVWLLMRLFREPTFAKLTLSAIALGCATYRRPVPVYLGLWLIPVFFVLLRKLSWSQRAIRAILFAVMFILTLAPWVIRNAVVADYKAFTSSQDWNLYFMSAAAVQAKLQHRNSSEVMAEWGTTTNIEDYLRTHPEQREWSEAQIARFWRTEAKSIILPHLLAYAVIHAKGCIRVIFNPGVTEVLRSAGIYPDSNNPLVSKLDQGFIRATLWLFQQYPATAILIPLMVMQLLFYYSLALSGLRRIPLEVGFLFCMLLLYFVLVSGFPSAMARYRVPVMPLVCICAGVAVANWRSKKSTAHATGVAQLSDSCPGRVW
jgi:4-amino-4-deoxy-L-arabinose transferase-like glycosyltransferase